MLCFNVGICNIGLSHPLCECQLRLLVHMERESTKTVVEIYLILKVYRVCWDESHSYFC